MTRRSERISATRASDGTTASSVCMSLAENPPVRSVLHVATWVVPSVKVSGLAK